MIRDLFRRLLDRIAPRAPADHPWAISRLDEWDGKGNHHIRTNPKG
jgi:hypothetical protein